MPTATVRYRRWRNSHESEAPQAEKEQATADLGKKVSAGELFNVDEQAPGISYEVPEELRLDRTTLTVDSKCWRRRWHLI